MDLDNVCLLLLKRQLAQYICPWLGGEYLLHGMQYSHCLSKTAQAKYQLTNVNYNTQKNADLRTAKIF